MNSLFLKKLRNYLLIMTMAGIGSGCAIFKEKYNFSRVNGLTLSENNLVMTVSVEKGYDDREFGGHVSDIKRTNQRYYQIIYPIEAGKTNQAQSITLIEEIKTDSNMQLLPTSDLDRVLEVRFSDSATKVTMLRVNSEQPIGTSYLTDESTGFGYRRYVLSDSSLFMATKGDGVVLVNIKEGVTEKVENWKQASPVIEGLKLQSNYRFEVTNDGRYLVAIPDAAFAVPALIYDSHGQGFSWSSSLLKENGHPIPIVKVQSINGELYFLCKKTALDKNASGLRKTTLFLETQKHRVIGSTESKGRIIWDPKNDLILLLPMSAEFSQNAFTSQPKIWHYREGKEEFVDFDVEDALSRMRQ